MSIGDKHSFSNKLYDYIPSGDIVEYDMKAAGLSIFREKGYISDSKWDELMSLPKKIRNIKVGLMQQKNRELNKVKSDGLKEYRNLFIDSNKLEEENIIAINSDAIFIVNAKVKIMHFGENIEFVKKSKFTAYYRLTPIIAIYYNSNTNDLVIKGIRDIPQYDPKIKFMKKLFKLNEANPHKARKYLYDTAKAYIECELEDDFYKEFIASGHIFKLKNGFSLDRIDHKGNSFSVHDLDITYNYMNFILPLIKIIY